MVRDDQGRGGGQVAHPPPLGVEVKAATEVTSRSVRATFRKQSASRVFRISTSALTRRASCGPNFRLRAIHDDLLGYLTKLDAGLTTSRNSSEDAQEVKTFLGLSAGEGHFALAANSGSSRFYGPWPFVVNYERIEVRVVLSHQRQRNTPVEDRHTKPSRLCAGRCSERWRQKGGDYALHLY